MAILPPSPPPHDAATIQKRALAMAMTAERTLPAVGKAIV